MKEQLSPLEKFLLWSSGADHRILAQEECLTERYKYSAIGMTILLTATMAFASGGYALFTVFASLPTSIVGGSFWGLTIFNLDRFFILSSKRKHSDSQTTFYAATALRLLIALLLSFVVAKPLELRLFENEINRELREEKIVESEKAELDNIEQQLQQSQRQKQEFYNDWQEAENNANQEAEGSGGSGNSGKGNLYQEKKDLAISLKQQFEQADNNVRQQQQEKNELRQAIKNTLQSSQNNSGQSEIELGSFLDRLVALEELSAKDPTIRSINLLITTLFIIIETAPVLVKTLSGKGSYDILLEQQEAHGIYQGYLRDRKEQEFQQAETILDNHLKSIMDFEQEVAKRKDKYLRLKEKSRENLNNRNIKNLREDLEKQQSQEILRFFDFCDRQLEIHLNMIGNEIKNHPDIVNNISQKLVDLKLSDRLHEKLITQYPEHFKKDLIVRQTEQSFLNNDRDNSLTN